MNSNFVSILRIYNKFTFDNKNKIAYTDWYDIRQTAVFDWLSIENLEYDCLVITVIQYHLYLQIMYLYLFSSN